MTMDKGFSPIGLRVLVVDDDPTWLKILERMLKKCSYEVTTCGLAREALRLLRERKDGYDIVISDVNMPDMDGFKLLEHVGLEMDLPVIMMSVDGETSRVMKGVQHEAGPKKILDLMNVPWLTRENVASHLSRLEKENVQKSSSGGVKRVDSPPKDVEINSGHQSPKKILPAEASTASHAFSGSKSPVQNANQHAEDAVQKEIASIPVCEPKINKPKKACTGFDHSLSPLASEGNADAFESMLSPQYSWNDVPEVLQQPLASQSYHVAHSAPSLAETDAKPSNESHRTCGVSQVAPVNGDLLLAQARSPTIKLQDFGLSDPSAIFSMKPQEFNASITSSNTDQLILTNLNWKLPESHFNTALDSDLQLCWLQGDCIFANSELEDIGCTSYSNQSLLPESPFYFYDAMRFANDLPDPDEYSLVDQGLFIA